MYIYIYIINSDHVGLYRDHGLMYIPNSNGPNTSSIQKKIIRAFKLLGFKIEISSNNKIVNFLDLTLDLSNNIYKPFIKMNQSPSYINVNSNHPKAIIKQVPKAVKLRIRNLSVNEEIFRKGSKMYIDALKSSGYKENFTYKEEKVPNGNDNNEINKENRRKNRKRKIIWFNAPPFCWLTNINIGKYFLKLVDKHFKHGNKLQKIFNRKTLKISYSCTKNIFQIINSHNKNITKEFQDQINNRNNNNNNNNNNSIKRECNCHHHHIALVARISLTLSRHSSLSFIALGRSSGQHPVSSHSCWMYVRAGRPAFARPCVGIHESTSLMSSSLLLQQCPACLVRLTGIVFVIGGRWPYSWCLVGCCCQDLFRIARSILV